MTVQAPAFWIDPGDDPARYLNLNPREAGWYLDPETQSREIVRYFDGKYWTVDTLPIRFHGGLVDPQSPLARAVAAHRPPAQDRAPVQDSDITYTGTVLKFACPHGNVVSHLLRTTDGEIRFRLADSHDPPAAWPPMRSGFPDYCETCSCAICLGRGIGSDVGILMRELKELERAGIRNEGTWVASYTPSAKYLLPREATQFGFVVRRQSGPEWHTERYERADRTVFVRYEDQEVVDVRVEPATTTYASTYTGAQEALHAPAGPPRPDAPTGPPWPTWSDPPSKPARKFWHRLKRA